MNITAIKKKVSIDYLRTNRYLCYFNVPSFISVPGLQLEDLYQSIIAVGTPQVSLETSPYTQNGIRQKFPFLVAYEDITLTILSDSKGLHKKFFDQWIRGVKNEKTGYFRYMDEYATNMAIEEFSTDGKSALKYELFTTYPISVSSVGLAYENQNQLEKFDVTLTFSSYELTNNS